jgi:pinoresinol/lariciresinol reductase
MKFSSYTNMPSIVCLHISADMDFASQVGVGHYYHIFYEGCLTNFIIGEDGAEATLLYPDVEYKSMDEYMKRYL